MKKLLCYSIVSLFALVGSINSTIVKAEETNVIAESDNFIMKKGASIRNTLNYEDTGIRFTAIVKKDRYEELIGSRTADNEVTFGMLIAPKAYVDVNALDYEHVFSETSVYDWANEDGEYTGTKVRISNITYNVLPSNVDGDYLLRGALTDILGTNITREFVGRGYIKIGNNENAQYQFAKYFDGDINNNSISISSVAKEYVSSLDEGEEKSWMEQYYINREQVNNNSFEDELTNWEVNDAFYADIAQTYWDVADYKQDEDYFLRFDQVGNTFLHSVEDKVGVARSQTFTLGGEGIISFKLGGAKNKNTYVKICKEDGEVLFIVRNNNFSDPKTAQIMLRKFVDAKEYIGQKLYVEVVDNAINDFGFVTFDDLRVSMTNSDALRLNEKELNNVKLVYSSKIVESSNDKLKELRDFLLNYYSTINFVRQNKFELLNGDFETGDLSGWKVDGKIGSISDSDNYWLNDGEDASGYAFNKEGKYLFSCYAPNQEESAIGSLTSQLFTIGGSGWITYKLGAMKNTSTRLEVLSEDGSVLETYYNYLLAERDLSNRKSGCTLISYKADLSKYLGQKVKLRLVDESITDYGLIFADDFKTYYEEEPSNEFNLASMVNSQIINGDFETGDLTGWRLISGEVPGKVTSLDGYWGGNISYNKDGDYLFTALEGQNNQTDPNLEGRMGVLRSSRFVISKGNWISFKLGASKNDVTGIRVIKEDGTIIASYHNTHFGEDGKEGYMWQYKYQLNNIEDNTICYIEIFDNATGDWGLVAVDSIRTDWGNVEPTF